MLTQRTEGSELDAKSALKGSVLRANSHPVSSKVGSDFRKAEFRGYTSYSAAKSAAKSCGNHQENNNVIAIDCSECASSIDWVFSDPGFNAVTGFTYDD